MLYLRWAFVYFLGLFCSVSLPFIYETSINGVEYYNSALRVIDHQSLEYMWGVAITAIGVEFGYMMAWTVFFSIVSVTYAFVMRRTRTDK
jgi:hypothetical protein